MTWYQINAATRSTDDDDTSHAEVLIYSTIGESWWEETVSAKSLVAELAELEVDTIDVRLNSPGGSVFDGNAIYNALRRHSASVTTYVDGCAASIASIIALAGDRVVMAPNAVMMVHNPWLFAMGDSAELRKAADLLDKLRTTLVGTYASRTLLPEDQIMQMMDAETWIDAEEAVEWGFAHAITDTAVDAAAVARFDQTAFAKYRHTPERVAAMAKAAHTEPATHTAPQVWQIELAAAARLREQAS